MKFEESHKMSDKPEENQNKEKKPEEAKVEEENNISTCDGGLTDEQLKTLQEDLDRAKESNSFSSSSRCVIV